MARATTQLFAVLCAGHVVVLLVSRTLLLGEAWVLPTWVAAGTLAGSLGAAAVGRLPLLRGLAGAVAFVAGWLLVGPLAVGALGVGARRDESG